MYLQTLRGQDIERIHDASVKVLAETGIWLHKSPEVAEFMASKGCIADGEHVLIPPEVLTDCLASVPDRNELSFGEPSLGYRQDMPLGQGQSHVTINGNAYTLYDYAAGRARDCVESDAAEFSLVAASLENIVADPCDMVFHSERTTEANRRQITFDTADAQDTYMRQWLAGRAGFDRSVGVNDRNLSDQESALAMLAFAARDGAAALDERLTRWEHYMWFNPLSPLQWHPEQAPIFLRLIDPDYPCRLILISPEVMLGATCPVTIAGALVQHNAEVLAGLVMAQLARPGVGVMYGFVGAAMDLRNAQISHGNLETALMDVAAVQIADHYGLPTRICPGNPSANAPGTRAAVETAVGLSMGIAAGGNVIMTGILDSTLMLSYEHLIVADEIVGQLLNINSGIATDAESLAAEVIANCGGPTGGFAYDEHTLRNVTRDIYYSDFVGRVESSYEEWYDKAHNKVKDILARRDDPVTDPEVLERLTAIQKRLAEDDASWRSKPEGWWRTYTQDFA